jgi:transcriptional regulator NrdR family protein
MPIVIPTHNATVRLERARDGYCPFCNNKNRDIVQWDQYFEPGMIQQRAHCHDCNSQWIETYDITEVTPVANPD